MPSLSEDGPDAEKELHTKGMDSCGRLLYSRCKPPPIPLLPLTPVLAPTLDKVPENLGLGHAGTRSARGFDGVSRRR